MAGTTFTYNSNQFMKMSKGIETKLGKASMEAIGEIADFMKKAGRQNIADAGFSKRWQNTWRVSVYPTGGVISLSPAAYGRHKIPYAMIFETGGTIAGSPLLWLPLPNVPLKYGNRRLTPKEFIQSIGPLHVVIRPGHPPLLAADMIGVRAGTAITIRKLRAGARAGGKGVIRVPLFYGISKVSIAQKFNIKGVIEQAGKMVGLAYKKALGKIR